MSQLDDMFQTYAAPTHQHWFGVTVTLKRGPRETTGVTATWTKPPENVDLEFVPTQVTERLYRIAKAAYVIADTAMKPQKHDRIVEQVGGREITFEVLPNEQLPEVELSGDGADWLIRTKVVKVV